MLFPLVHITRKALFNGLNKGRYAESCTERRKRQEVFEASWRVGWVSRRWIVMYPL